MNLQIHVDEKVRKVRIGTKRTNRTGTKRYERYESPIGLVLSDRTSDRNPDQKNYRDWYVASPPPIRPPKTKTEADPKISQEQFS